MGIKMERPGNLGFVGNGVGKLLGLKLMVLLVPLPIPGAWNLGVYWASHRENRK